MFQPKLGLHGVCLGSQDHPLHKHKRYVYVSVVFQTELGDSITAVAAAGHNFHIQVPTKAAYPLMARAQGRHFEHHDL